MARCRDRWWARAALTLSHIHWLGGFAVLTIGAIGVASERASKIHRDGGTFYTDAEFLSVLPLAAFVVALAILLGRHFARAREKHMADQRESQRIYGLILSEEIEPPTWENRITTESVDGPAQARVRNTDIRVIDVVDAFSSGLTMDELTHLFPGLDVDDVKACIDCARSQRP